MENHESNDPGEFRYDSGFGLIVQSYDTWTVDIRTADGGLLKDVFVIGPRLPEASTPERPQWAYYEFANHANGRPRCHPVASRLPGNRDDRRSFVYYEEVGHYRLTIDREGQFEVINRKDPGKPLQVRVREDGNEVRFDTPKTRIVLSDDDGKITLEADQDIALKCTNASVEASGNVDIQATGGNVAVSAGGSASVQATGAVSISGATVSIN